MFSTEDILREMDISLDNDEMVLFRAWCNDNQGVILRCKTMRLEALIREYIFARYCVDRFIDNTNAEEKNEKELTDLTEMVAKLEWKRVQHERARRAKLNSQEKQSVLRAEILAIMGTDSGMTAQEIARELERACKASGAKPSYSCGADKNGNSSMTRNIEKHLPSLRKEIKAARFTKTQD